MQRIRDLWSSDRGRLAHYLVAASLGIFAIVEYATLKNIVGDTGRQPRWITALAVVAAVALLFSRRFPFVAPLVASGAIAMTLPFVPEYVSRRPTLRSSSPFSSCRGASARTTTAGARWSAWSQRLVGIGFYANYVFAEGTADYAWVGSFIVVSWSVGFILSRRAQQAREMTERAERLEREHRDAADRAVTEERQRIARELHDVIAHSVSVMTVQTSAVRRLLRPEQEREREALETVEATGRDALTEMRRLVGLLREQGAMPEFSPQPGMGTIDSLLDGVRSAGLPVELEVDGEPRELPAGVDLAAYRVVQEALTNALKYAGPAHAWVAVHWGADELELEIANDGHEDADDGDGSGHGLAGMRERVSLYGGDIESGARDGGGYVVRARLPLQEVAT